MQNTIHIVASLRGLSGAETHAATLAAALRKAGTEVQLWSDQNSQFANRYGGKVISPFTGVMPRGGTLILIGAYLGLEPWIDYVKPARLILVCINSDAQSLYAMLARLERPSLPSVELVYVSKRLQKTMVLPGRICPEIMDLDLFYPASTQPDEKFIVGRLSRDVPEKHHADDPSLYRMLAFNGAEVRIMGGTCLGEQLNGTPAVSLLAAGAEPAPAFLRSLSVFFYRTSPDWHEPSGRVVMEALASGLPVVAHTSGGYTDWISHGENGFLFEQQEDAWQYLLRIKADPALLKKLSINARISAEQFSGETARNEYIAWLNNAAIR